MNLSIITVNYNVKEFLEQAISSIQKSCHNIDYELFVVDNASSDGSIELIHSKFPQVKLIANTENRGFSAANNQALKLAQGEFILLINPDTIVREDTFSVILNFFKQHPGCGMVGCKILNPDGNLQPACRRSFPTPWVAFTKIVGLGKLFPRSKLFGRYNLTYLDPDRTYEVEAISGSFMFFRRSILNEVGYLDESFFMYGEDLDWCFRIREAGWKIYYLPETKIIHFKGESSKKSDIDLILQFYRAMKLFVEKHYHHRYLQVPQWLLMAGITLRASLSFVKKFLNWISPGLVDYILLNVAMVLAIYIRFHSLIHLRSYLIVMVVYAVMWLFCLSFTGSYGRTKYSSLHATYGVITGLILNTSLTFFFNQYAFSRAVVLISGMLNMLLLGGWRLGLRILSHFQVVPLTNIFGQNLLRRRTLIVAPIASGQTIAAKLGQRLDNGYEVFGIICPEDELIHNHNQEVPILGSIKYLHEIIRQKRAQEIIFSTEKISYDQILEIIAHTRKGGVNFKLIPRSMDVIIGKASVEYIGDLPLMDINYKLNQPVNIYLKRIFDLMLSLPALIIVLPEICYLMFVKGSRLRKKYIYSLHSNQPIIFELMGEHLSSLQKKLPYLWSVVTGKLSIVGSKIIEVEEPQPPKGGLELKPGLTGLVQIHRQHTLTKDDCEKYNLFYLKNYSVLLDIKIIIKAVVKI